MSEADRRVVLHAVRLGSLLAEEGIANRTGTALDVVRAVLEEAREQGLAIERTGRAAGWSLTAAGRAEGVRLLAAEVDERGAGPAVSAAYEQFRTVNAPFLVVCTRWQLRDVDGEQVSNDHADRAHDEAVLAELEVLHRVVVDRVAEPASAALGRFRPYRTRFEHAIERVRGGDLDWFTRPMIDSYHTVWFELHDDLLATLGLDRAAERERDRADLPAEPMHAAPPTRDQTGGAGTLTGPAAEE